MIGKRINGEVSCEIVEEVFCKMRALVRIIDDYREETYYNNAVH